MTGAVVPSLFKVTVIVKVWLADVSSPPFAVPPLFISWTVTVAVPNPCAVGV